MVTGETMTETLAAVERFCGPGEPVTASELAEQLGCTRRTAYDRLERLANEGELETKKIGARGRIWWQPDAGGPDESIAAVLDGAEVGVFVLDEEFDVAWINEATERYFGLDRDDVVGRDKRALIEETIASRVENSEAFTEEVFATYDDNSYAERFECRVREGEDRADRRLEHRSKPIERGRYAGGRVELYYDISRRRETERVLDESERQFQSLIDATDEYAIFRLDADGRVTTWNSGAETLKGYDRSEIVGEHVATFYADEDVEAGVPEQNLAEAADEGTVEVEGWRVRKDGTRFRADVTINAIYDDEGEVEGFAKVIRDTTERLEYERRLQRQRDSLEHELDEVFERIDDAFYALDEEFRFNYVNEQAEELLQHRAEDLIGENFWEAFPGVAETKTGENFRLAVETQEPTSYEVYSDNLEFWVEANVYPSESGLSVYFRDVSDRKERERELELYERIVETVGDGVYAIDDESRYVFANGAFCEMIDWDREDLLGEPATVVYDDEIASRADEAASEVSAGERDVATLEFELVTADGDRIPVESRFGPLPYGDGEGRCGVVRDVTERKERERALRKSEQRYRTLVENFPNGGVTLYDDDLRHLLVEGRGFEELGFDAADLLGERVPDVYSDEVVETLEPNYRAALDGDPREFEVVVGERTFEFWTHPVTDDDGEVFAGMAMSQDVTDRIERQRKLERQRGQLEALNELNAAVLDIAEVVVEQSTREEIEQVVCDSLAASDAYEFAWMAGVDPATESIEPRIESGVDGYLDEIRISVDPDDPTGRGPAGRAIQARELQVVDDALTDPSFEPWRDAAREYGYRSAAAIPITHEGTIYGVLGVYAPRPEAFTGEVRRVLRQLGEVTGHAIAAVERKRALIGDELVEVEFRIRDLAGTLDLEVDDVGRITLDQTVPLGGDEYLVYGGATEDGRRLVDALVEILPHWDDVTFGDDGSPKPFELTLVDPPVLTTIASLGGTVDEAVVEDGDYRMTVHLSPGVDVRQVIDSVKDTYPSAELVTRRQITSPESSIDRVRDVVGDDLTERQRAALESAFYAGFFDWPRRNSGEDVAESLGISSPTFHQHVRAAERKVFESLLEHSPRTAE